ncbi:MAG: hypothetical protein JW923_04650 [Spirochaetales bacterium]|nr:hypothetical protein [Spirochaetales bacterium]
MRGTPHTQGVGTAVKAGSGAFVFMKAEGRLPSGLWSVLVDGQRLMARAERPLQPGAVYGAVREGAGRISARAPDFQSRASEFLVSLGLPDDKASRLALSALMAEGLPLGADQLRAARRAASRRDDPESARLAARALAAGLDPDNVPVDLVLGPPADGGGRDGSGKGDGSQAGPDAPDGQDGLSDALKAAVGAALADASYRALAAPGPDGRGWLYAPFDFGGTGFEFRGFARILFNYVSLTAERMVVELRGPERRVVELAGSGDTLRLSFLSDSGAERAGFERLFPGGETGSLDAAAGYEAVDSDA